jgi:hypothetical protein
VNNTFDILTSMFPPSRPMLGGQAMFDIPRQIQRFEYRPPDRRSVGQD